jgi:hypothetical protein
MVLYPGLAVAAIVFVVVGALAALLSVAALTRFVTTNRQVRLARHQSLRAYYGRLLVPSH